MKRGTPETEEEEEEEGYVGFPTTVRGAGFANIASCWSALMLMLLPLLFVVLSRCHSRCTLSRLLRTADISGTCGVLLFLLPLRTGVMESLFLLPCVLNSELGVGGAL